MSTSLTHAALLADFPAKCAGKYCRIIVTYPTLLAMGISGSTARTSLARRLLRDGAGREIRVGVCLSQVELAKLIGCSTSALNRWESGSRKPTGALAERYFDALTMLADLDDGDSK